MPIVLCSFATISYIAKHNMKLENVKFAFVTKNFIAELLCDKLDVFMALNENAMQTEYSYSLQWRHNGHGSVSNHQTRYCLLNRLFRRR